MVTFELLFCIFALARLIKMNSFVIVLRLQILDYAQYYLLLPDANYNKRANWRLEYNLKDYYDLNEVSAVSLHDLADRLTQPSNNAFVR